MITEKDLQEAIAECQGKRNPDANTCIKLAAYYTIKENLYPSRDLIPYTYTPQVSQAYVDYQGDSEFAKVVEGRDAKEVWAVMDELMDALSVVNPRLYESVLRKLQ